MEAPAALEVMARLEIFGQALHYGSGRTAVGDGDEVREGMGWEAGMR